jgi:SAM-dependent methyltransferase
MGNRKTPKKVLDWFRSLTSGIIGCPDGTRVCANAVFDAKKYWEQRYRCGGTSGSGSEGILAEYKAGVVNRFLREEQIHSVLEFGCGDGNQLSLMEYKEYTGTDIAASALELCRRKFQGKPNWRFLLYDPTRGVSPALPEVDLVVCLDVLYHIIEEQAFLTTLRDIFRCAKRYVILYTNIGSAENTPPHIKWRDTQACLAQFPSFRVLEVLEQPYPALSGANFILLARRDTGV